MHLENMCAPNGILVDGRAEASMLAKQICNEMNDKCKTGKIKHCRHTDWFALTVFVLCCEIWDGHSTT